MLAIFVSLFFFLNIYFFFSLNNKTKCQIHFILDRLIRRRRNKKKKPNTKPNEPIQSDIQPGRALLANQQRQRSGLEPPPSAPRQQAPRRALEPARHPAHQLPADPSRQAHQRGPLDARRQNTRPGESLLRREAHRRSPDRLRRAHHRARLHRHPAERRLRPRLHQPHRERHQLEPRLRLGSFAQVRRHRLLSHPNLVGRLRLRPALAADQAQLCKERRSDRREHQRGVRARRSFGGPLHQQGQAGLPRRGRAQGLPERHRKPRAGVRELSGLAKKKRVYHNPSAGARPERRGRQSGDSERHDCVARSLVGGFGAGRASVREWSSVYNPFVQCHDAVSPPRSASNWLALESEFGWTREHLLWDHCGRDTHASGGDQHRVQVAPERARAGDGLDRGDGPRRRSRSYWQATG